MKFSNPQLWLLLWKDYLIRKRKPVTIGGIIWAAATIISLVIVRSNVYPDEKPTCQFASRALPSAGVLPFLQSFICTINNECDSIDAYEDIHNYNKSRLSQLYKQFSPIFNNETIMETIRIIPNSIKLLSTVTRVIDNKEIHHIVYNGFRLQDIFKDPEVVEFILSQYLMAPRKIIRTLLESSVNFENVISKIMDVKNITCDEYFFQEMLISNSSEDITNIANIICKLNASNIEQISYPLFYEIDVEKYIGIIGDIFKELTGKNTMKDIGAMINSVIKLSNLKNYIPLEFKTMQTTFYNISKSRNSYVNLNLVHNFINTFEPLFGDSDVYKSIINTMNTLTDGMNFLKNSVMPKSNNTFKKYNLSFEDYNNTSYYYQLDLSKKVYLFIDDTENFIKSLKHILNDQQFSATDVIDVIGGIFQVVAETLPKESKHHLLYYITLIDKMLSGAYNTLRTNLYMEEKIYNSTLKHPKGVEKILKLGPDMISKIIDGLTDVDRVQILTRKIYHPGQMFCDLYKLQVFFKISKEEATKIKPIVCDSGWKNYITDIIESFGVNNISTTINKMASFVVAETLGKSNEANFIKVHDLFDRIHTFVKYISVESVNSKNRSKLNWTLLFKEENFHDIENVLKSKSHQINTLLVTVNTALAREVISSNAILETYITPTLIKLKTILKSISNEIENLPKDLLKEIKKNFVGILETILNTFIDKEKVLNLLTLNQTYAFCSLVENCSLSKNECISIIQSNKFINFPLNKNPLNLTVLFCNISKLIANELNAELKDNQFIKTIHSIFNDPEKKHESVINWTELILIIQKLYTNIDTNFGFLLKIGHIATDKDLIDIEKLTKKVLPEFLMSLKVNDVIKLGFSSAFNILQVLDSNLFNLSQTTNWRSMKNQVDKVNSLFYMTNIFMKLFKVITLYDDQFEISELPITSKITKDLIFNIPSLINELTIFILKEENFEIQEIVNLINTEDSWPCSNISLSSVLKFQNNATVAIKAMETILCIDEKLKNEWDSFLHISKIMEITKNSSNVDDIKKDIFFTTARNFNVLIENLSKLQEFSKSLIINRNKSKKYIEGLRDLWKPSINIINESKINITILRHVLKNINFLLTNITNDDIDMSHSTSNLWEFSISCFHEQNNVSNKKCKKLFWNALKYSIMYISEGGNQMAADLTEYFNEISDSNVNVLQIIGFTKKTGPYIMYDKLPDIIDAFFNSLSDQGFMKQIYRSLGKRFWDCERILDSVLIMPYSKLTKSNINSIKPYICPSLIHWVSIPINENVLLDLFAKSQFLFFSTPISEFNTTFEQLMDKSLVLNEKIATFSKKDNFTYSFITNDWINKFQNIGETLTMFNNDISVMIFGSKSLNNPYAINIFKIMYLLETTRLLNYVEIKLKEIKDLNFEKLLINQNDLKIFVKLIERKSTDLIEIFMVAFTKKIIENNNLEDFNVIQSLEEICNDTDKKFSNEINLRTLNIFCKTEYKKILEILKNDSNNSLEFYIKEFLNTTNNIVELSKQNNIDKKSVHKKLLQSMIEKNSPNQTNFLKTNIKYAYDFSLNSYLQYLNMKLEHYLIALDFLTGDDWWSTIKQFYNSTYSNIFIDFIENLPIIVEEILNNVSKIKIIRLIKDMKYNNTELLCNSSVSEYIPDSTGQISIIKDVLCSINITKFYMEVKPIRFAAYVYDHEFIDNEKITDEKFNLLINQIKEKIVLLDKGPQKPKLPNWITNEIISKLQNYSLTPMLNTNKIDIIFFFLHNFVDGITLFMNSTYSIPSTITPWIKQINLQLIKKDEYVVFLCDLRNMNISEVYTILINDFHWDLALSEITSGRNYTWIEMNKSISHLVEQIRLYIHDVNYGQLNKLSECLQNTSISNSINKLSLYITIGSNIMKLIRASSLHFKNIDGFTSSSAWQHYFSVMKSRIPVYIELEQIMTISNFSNFIKNFSSDLHDSKNWKININQFSANLTHYEIEKKNIKLKIPSMLINASNISKILFDYQYEAFWSMKWFSDIIFAIEQFLWHLGRIVYKISIIDWEGLKTKEVVSFLNLILQISQKTYLKSIAENLDNITSQLHPLTQNLEFEVDIKNVARGLSKVHDLIDGLDDNELNFEMNKSFNDWKHIINEVQSKTNITSLTLNIMQHATWNIIPILKADSSHVNIREWTCKTSMFLSVFSIPYSKFQSSLDKIRLELCNIPDDELKVFIRILFQNINFTRIIDNVIKILSTKIVNASNLTSFDGEQVIKNIGNIFKSIPKLQQTILNASDLIFNEPIIKSFQKSSKFTDLLYDPNFFSNVGNMLCGKPFKVNISRFYKVIATVKDSAIEPDHKHLNSLPNDFCKELYQEIIKMDGGKILWSYAKPMLMGKILYTPNQPEFQKIINNANETFVKVGNLFTLVHNFSDGFTSIEEIMKHNISLFTMQKLLQSEMIQNKLTEFFGESISKNNMQVNLTNVLENLKNITTMKLLLMKLSSMTKCISIDRFEQIENETSLEKRAAELMELNEFSAGLVFLSDTKYKIRMDIDNVPSTSRIKNRFWMPGPNANFIEHLRYFRGFIQLQDMVDKAIITSRTLNTNTSHKRILRNIYDNENNFNLSTWEIYTQQMPYPCYIQDEFKTILYESQALIIAFFFSLILVVASIVRNLVWERETGNISLMCVMRMKRKKHTLSWFLSSLIEILVVMIVLCFILKIGNILPKSNPIVLLAILFNFGVSVVMFCYMVTSFFKSASLGAVSAVIIYLIFFMPYVIVISLEAVLTFPQKLATSLFMSTGFCYSLLLIARFEVQGTGLQWMNINESPLIDDPISVLNTCFIVFFDAVLYCVVGFIINRIRFDDKINIDYIADNLNELSVGVKIKNISKSFKTYKKNEIKALDNVNINLHKGQITTLLGRNGAGKTTLIKILTGTLKPDSGSIIINKQSNHENNGDEKNYIGLCPQTDILLEFMTSREHLLYYARLKTNLSFDKIKCDVESMLDIMGLSQFSDEPVNKLSGGLRRRLCVGLAFIANPHLVILDEPSSGVDPVARRDIWSLIVSLKGSRTILLTTHHLDEAELLSDTLIIMHKGKVLTHNSPLELKHKYGLGYSLTITYSHKSNMSSSFPLVNQNSDEETNKYNKNIDIINESDYENVDLLEKMKINAGNLLQTIRTIISNCALQNINKDFVTIVLPYLSENGQSQDFAKAISVVEEKKSILNYANMTIDSSSLEQVFLDICKNTDSENMSINEYNDEKKIIAGKSETSSNINCTSSVTNSENMDISHMKTDKISLVNEKNILRAPFVKQILTLLKKRFLHYRRNYRLLIITLLLPAIFVAFAMGFSLIRPPDDSEDPIQLSSSLYNKFSSEFISFSQLYDLDKNSNKIIKTLMDNSIDANNRSLEYWTQNTLHCECSDGYQKCKKKSLYLNETEIPAKNKIIVLPSTKSAIDWIVNTQNVYTEKRYGGWSVIDDNPNSQHTFMVWYNNKGDHALPSYVNTLNSAILKNKLNYDANITIFNHPLKLSQEQLSRSSLLQHVADVGIGVVLLIGFSLVPAGGAIYLVNERVHQEKRLQLLCGVSPFTYWLSALLWDILITCGAITLAIIVFEIFGLPVYLYRENIPAISLLLLLYGISCSTLMYILEKLFTDSSLANMILFCSNVFIGVVGLTILLIIDVLSNSEYMDHIRWVLHKLFLIFPQFVLGDGLVEISKNTIQAILLSRFGMNTYLSPLKWELMGNHYVSLSLTAILFFSINMCYEYNLLDFIFIYFQKDNQFPSDIDEEDYDVITEKYRVELATLKPHYNMSFNNDMTSSNGDKVQNHVMQMEKNDILQIISLRKIYNGVIEKRAAVNNVTLGLKSGQCFGLLGVNGAGKSTTFKMLTGELKPSYGDIYLHRRSVTQKDLCNGSIAYCPQVDSLDNLLTVYEHLEFYSRLRGLSRKENKIMDTLKEFDLLKYAHQKSNTLSGGNKRKLCTAISLLGNAPIVLLDEPTSGMDPGARYNTGLAIKRSIEAGRCLLLSSHSLAECETLCQRVAVMALGKFLAIGPPQYLKNKFGGGYLVSIRLALPNQSGQLIQLMSETFPFVHVQNSHYCTTQFLISMENHKKKTSIENIRKEHTRIFLSDIFLGLNKIGNKITIIEYSVNQSSLDQVFINFSHYQTEKQCLPNALNGPIRLSTLERQYSKNKDHNTNSEGIFVTKF